MNQNECHVLSCLSVSIFNPCQWCPAQGPLHGVRCWGLEVASEDVVGSFFSTVSTEVLMGRLRKSGGRPGKA